MIFNHNSIHLRSLMKVLPASAAIFAMAFMASCGNSVKETENSEETAAMIEAAQIEGRGAARRVINRTFNDSLALQGAILEANAAKSKYQMENKPECEAAFDSAFISTIRTTRPDLARQLAK